MVWPSRPIIKLLRAQAKVKDNHPFQISVFVMVLSFFCILLNPQKAKSAEKSSDQDSRSR